MKITERRPGKRGNFATEVPQETINKVLKLKKSGLTYVRIAEVLGTSRAWVSKICGPKSASGRKPPGWDESLANKYLSINLIERVGV